MSFPYGVKEYLRMLQQADPREHARILEQMQSDDFSDPHSVGLATRYSQKITSLHESRQADGKQYADAALLSMIADSLQKAHGSNDGVNVRYRIGRGPGGREQRYRVKNAIQLGGFPGTAMDESIQPGLTSFAKIYADPSGQYETDNIPGENHGRRYDGTELLSKYGTLVGSDLTSAMHTFLKDAVEADVLSPKDVSELGKMGGLRPADVGHLRSALPSEIIRKQEKAEARAAKLADRASAAAPAKQRRANPAQYQQQTDEQIARKLRMDALRATYGGSGGSNTPTPPAGGIFGGAGEDADDEGFTRRKFHKARAKLRTQIEDFNTNDPDLVNKAGGPEERAQIAAHLGAAGLGIESDAKRNAAVDLLKQKRELADIALREEYINSNRQGEIGGASYKADRYQRFSASGIAIATDAPRVKTVKPVKPPRTLSTEEQARRQRAEIKNTYEGELFAAQDNGQTSDEAKKAELLARYKSAGVAVAADIPRPKLVKTVKPVKPPKPAPPPPDEMDELEKKRAEIRRTLQNEYIANGDTKKLGGARFDKDLKDRFKKEDVATASDNKGSGLGLAGGIAFFRVIRGLEQAAGAGGQIGAGVSNIVAGVDKAILGAAHGFTAIGEHMLGMMFAPFGKAGEGMASIGGGIAKGLTSALSAGGAIVAAGVKVGVAFQTGMILGAGVGLGAGIGALFGAFAGGAAGALTGAGFGALLFGSIAQAFGTLVSTMGGAIGQALGAIGSAFGELGKGIGDTLSSIKDVLTDLIQTGNKFAQAINTVRRGSGMSAGASGQFVGLSQILTGSPGGLNSFYNGFGTMAPYIASRAAAFGVGGVNANNPLGMMAGAYRQYSAMEGTPMGAVRQQLLLKGLFPGISEQVGGLFSAGPQAVGMAMQGARQTAVSPREVQNIALMNVQLDVMGARLERIKTKFLGELMPAITTGLRIFGDWFGKNESKIIGSLEKIGRWFFVKFPTYIDSGIDTIANLGKSFLGILPIIAEVGRAIGYTMQGVVKAVQQVASFVGPVISMLGNPKMGAALSSFGGMPLASLGLSNGQIEGAADSISGSNRLKGHTLTVAQERMNELESLRRQGHEALRGLGLSEGQEKQRAAAFDKQLEAARKADGQGGTHVDLTIKVEDKPDALFRITAHSAQQNVRALQRASSY